MGRKRFTKWDNERVINDSNFVNISKKVSGIRFYEIGDELTTDLSEAVAIMIRNPNLDEKIWGMDIDCNLDQIETTKCLYWLTGGDREWQTLHNYRLPWAECRFEFNERFGSKISEIIKNSKTFGDIRDGFLRHLNLPILYEFALERDFVR